MHPILRSRALLGAYLFGWALFGAIFVFSARWEQASWRDAIVLGSLASGLGAGLFLSSYFPCRALPLRTTPPLVLCLGWLGAAFVMGGTWAGLLILAAKPLMLLPAYRTTWQGWAAFALMGVFMYVVTVAMYYVIIAHHQSEEAERNEQELRVLAREAELKALRAQLNPHFLFNSLNSISALTTIDPKRAREMCVLLSDFFRKGLKLGERPLVPLAEEIDLLKSYLAIERIRFGSRLDVHWEVDPDAEGISIPALLLQPLVENAIKHGIAQLPEGGTIRIRARARASFAEISVENPADPDAEPPQGLGMGLRQVRARLLGRFGEDIRFEAGVIDGLHRVAFTFPIEDSHE